MVAHVVPIVPPEQEGAVKKSVVFTVLRANGVEISDIEDGMTRLAKGDVIDVQRLGPYVRRRLVSRFAREFNLPISSFY